MKNKQIFLFVFAIILLTFLLKIFIQSPCKNKQAVLYNLENKNYCLLVADNSREWTKGLMNYKKPVDFDGMVFIFSKKEIQNFWNMNTYLDLNLYWLDDEKVVGKSFLPSISRTKNVSHISSPKPVNRVIEIIK